MSAACVLLGVVAGGLVTSRTAQRYDAAASGTPAATSQSATTAAALLRRTDLIYGSQIYQTPEDGGIITHNTTAIANAKAAGIRVVRFQMAARPTTLGGTESPATFDTALQSIYNIGAIPMVDLPPSGKPQLPGTANPYSLQWAEWIVKEAASKGVVIFEVGNEPNNKSYGAFTPTSYFNSLWSMVPTLRSYAQSLGYSGLLFGGPAWMDMTTHVADIESFLSLCQQKYQATNDARWLPDFVSGHGYGGYNGISAWMAKEGGAWDSLRSWTDAHVTNGKNIKFVDSEYNIGIQSNIGTTYLNQATMNQFYAAKFAMASGKTVDGQQRLWITNEFCIEPAGTGLMLLSANGTPMPAYNAFKAIAASVPRQTGGGGPTPVPTNTPTPRPTPTATGTPRPTPRPTGSPTPTPRPTPTPSTGGVAISGLTVTPNPLANPGSSTTVISFTLSGAAVVSIDVVSDATGAVVRHRMSNVQLLSGSNVVKFWGVDDALKPLPSGSYTIIVVAATTAGVTAVDTTQLSI